MDLVMVSRQNYSFNAGSCSFFYAAGTYEVAVWAPSEVPIVSDLAVIDVFFCSSVLFVYTLMRIVDLFCVVSIILPFVGNVDIV